MEATKMTLMRWKPGRGLWDPFDNLSDLQHEMNRLFDTSLHRIGLDPAASVFNPAIDVFEEKDSLIVRAELPGLAREEVHVSLQDDVLTIRGERKQETERKDDGRNYYYRERVSGSFHRTIHLPLAVDPKNIDAKFKDGVLEVTLPKAEEAKPRQIEIAVG